MHRLYETDDITVFWDSEKCRHAKQCVTGCPEVFDIQRKPWIDLSRAECAKIWKAVSKCPTGALTVAYNHGIRVAFVEAENRSVAYDGDREVGECSFISEDGAWKIVHTESHPDYQGKGIAKRLVFSVTEQAEKRKIQVVPICSYAVKVLGGEGGACGLN